jgi:hypothetical protein
MGSWSGFAWAVGLTLADGCFCCPVSLWSGPVQPVESEKQWAWLLLHVEPQRRSAAMGVMVYWGPRLASIGQAAFGKHIAVSRAEMSV